MADYIIKLKLNANTSDADHAFIAITDDSFEFTFKDDPDVGEVSIGPTLLDTVTNARTVFEFDMNLQGKYVSYVENGDTLVIEAASGTVPTLSSYVGNYTFTAVAQVAAISIESAIKENASSSLCNNINIHVTTNEIATELTSPYTDSSLNSDDFILQNQARGQTINIAVKDINDNTDSLNVTTPGFLNDGLVEVNVNINNVSVNDLTTGLNLQYSLDNVNWNTTGSFNNQSAGNYTMYIKDEYGCSITKSFTIEAGTGVEPVYDDYFLYSEANPIRMAKREQWDNYSVLKNAYNTLSCEEAIDDVVYTEKHYLLENDNVRLQVRNTYNDLAISLSDGTVLMKEQMTNNMNLKSSYDAKVIQLGDGKIGIYFISGNEYDYDTGATTGTHSLNGELPGFAKVGTAVTVNNFNYLIEDIIFNYDANAKVIVITSTITDIDVIAKAIYNLLDYEVYEFGVPLAGKTLFNIKIFFNGKTQYVSELINIVEHREILIKILYSMSYNTDIFFNSGFEGCCRFLVDTNKSAIDNENDKFNTDTEFYQVNSSNFEVDVFKFLPLTKQVARQLVLILSHDTININGINYVKDTIETEPLERSNLYVVTATMKIKEGSKLDSGDNSLIDIQLINYETNKFIKIS